VDKDSHTKAGTAIQQDRHVVGQEVAIEGTVDAVTVGFDEDAGHHEEESYYSLVCVFRAYPVQEKVVAVAVDA